ncbi:MAG TPA: glycosyltransferase [Candidatus Limnocylindria bacterium]|nr:glycosyltransferase [Candidatus Limnocylindria bacterium]
MALAHDYLDQYGGGERTIAAMAERYPAAPLYTSVYDRTRMRELGFPELSQPVVVSFMQRLPLRHRLPRHYFTLLYPFAFRSFDLRGYDVVLSCSTFAAKAVAVGPRTVHVCYCLTPPRFLWGFDSDTAARAMPAYERPLASIARRVLRPIDRRTARRVNLFVASSRVIADRIRATYGRAAEVVHPPVDTERFAEMPTRDDGFLLIVSRLNAYKRIDYVIDACNARRLSLVIAGTGPWEQRLRARAGPTVRMLGAVSDAEVARLMSSCTAFVLPGEEDFGIAAVEAMAAGKPVLALRRGGATETVVDGLTGVLYEEPTPDAFLRARDALTGRSWSAAAARERARDFDTSRFVQGLDRAVARAVERGPGAFQ